MYGKRSSRQLPHFPHPKSITGAMTKGFLENFKHCDHCYCIAQKHKGLEFAFRPWLYKFLQGPNELSFIKAVFTVLTVSM